MTEYVVTVGMGKPEIYRSKSQFDAISYAEMYAGRHIANVSVHTNEGQIVFSLKLLMGSFIQLTAMRSKQSGSSLLEREFRRGFVDTIGGQNEEPITCFA